MSGASPQLRPSLERRLTAPMVVLSFLFLLLLGTLIHRLEHLIPQFERLEGAVGAAELEMGIMVGALLLLWPLFFLEFFVYFWTRAGKEPFWGANGYALAACFVPPLRIGSRVAASDGHIWVPFLGWRARDRHLRKQLEKFFSVPMIVIALMILPLLALEYGEWEWARGLREHPWVQHALFFGQSVIWFAFAVEFSIMISVADSKAYYCLQHWLDLAIILLPLLAFMRSTRLLRLSRVARLDQLGRMARLYRLRGLTLRAWRAVLLLNVIQRVTGQSLEKRLKLMEDLLHAKEDEVDDLRKDIAALRKKIEEKRQAAAALPLDREPVETTGVSSASPGNLR